MITGCLRLSQLRGSNYVNAEASKVPEANAWPDAW